MSRIAAHYFSSAERSALDATIRRGERLCRAEISLFVGDTRPDDPRERAERLHASLAAPERSILLLVDPGARRVEVVTGSWVRRSLDDGQVRLAVAGMTRSFADGDLAGGLRRGILHLAEHARPARTLHAAD